MSVTRRQRTAVVTIQATQAALATAASAYLGAGVPLLSLAGVSAALLPAVGLLLPAYGALLYYTRTRFPQQKPGELGKAVAEAMLLRKKGLDPVITTNPYTGELTIGTSDQPLDILLAERAIRTLTPPQDTARIYELRQELIRQSAETAVSRGFFPTVESLPKIPKGITCGLTRPTADAPLEYVCRSDRT